MMATITRTPIRLNPSRVDRDTADPRSAKGAGAHVDVTRTIGVRKRILAALQDDCKVDGTLRVPFLGWSETQAISPHEATAHAECLLLCDRPGKGQWTQATSHLFRYNHLYLQHAPLERVLKK